MITRDRYVEILLLHDVARDANKEHQRCLCCARFPRAFDDYAAALRHMLLMSLLPMDYSYAPRVERYALRR